MLVITLTMIFRGVGLAVLAMASALCFAQEFDQDFANENAPALVTEEFVTAQEQLEAIKRSLMDYAFDHESRVTANAWIDGEGRYDESVSVFSHIDLERIRISHPDNRFGQPEIALVEPVLGSKFAGECVGSAIRKKRVLIKTQPVVAQDTAALALGHQVQGFVTQAMLQDASGVLGAATTLQTQVKMNTRYQRYMVSKATPASDLTVELSVSVAQRVTRIMERARPPESLLAGYALTIAVTASDNGQRLYEDKLRLHVSRPKLRGVAVRLEGALKDALTQWLYEKLPELAAIANCVVDNSLEVNLASALPTVSGGEDVGIQLGQKFVLLPSSASLTASGLEAGMNSVALAEVVQVNARTAFLNIYAGDSVAVLKPTIAIPLADIDSFRLKG